MEILWAVQIAKSENFHSIIIGGDVKIYFDALNSDLEKCNWAIASRYSDMLKLSEEFVNCNSSWIKRDVNYVTHFLAKFTSYNKLTFFFF